MAVRQRRPEGVIHHSDQGSQYTSLAFGKRCREMGVRPSTGSAGECYDNAMAESFFATLECELIARRSFHTRAEAKMALFDFIEGWYNPHRRHSSPGYLGLNDFECTARRGRAGRGRESPSEQTPLHPRLNTVHSYRLSPIINALAKTIGCPRERGSPAWIRG